MNETQQNIKAYEAALPHLRERVAAVALLLLMSVCMITSATFAWLTISRAPEVSGVNTTVAANGNLEIALVNPEGSEPAESRVGDSMAAADQKVTVSNLTWGNLINLSDESYGLEGLILRPATLNTSSLLKKPLYAASYGGDGRVSQLTSDFSYTTWHEAGEYTSGYFGLPENGENAYGVRAISSLVSDASGAEEIYQGLKRNAETLNNEAGGAYQKLALNDDYMETLAALLGYYMQYSMLSLNSTCKYSQIEQLWKLYTDFIDAYKKEAEALSALANLQLYAQGASNYKYFTPADMYTKAVNQVTIDGESYAVQISDWATFIKDYNTLMADYEKLTALYEQKKDISWGAEDNPLIGIMNNLVDANKCTLSGKTIAEIKAAIKDDLFSAGDYMKDDQKAVITNGLLYNFELRTGWAITAHVTLSVTILITTITMDRTEVTTNAAENPNYYLFEKDLAKVEEWGADGGYGSAVFTAADTYGLAIDLWVRTNAEDSYLTLGGNILTTDDKDPASWEVALGKDANGNVVELHTATRTETPEGGEPVTSEVEVYSLDGTWYDANTHLVIPATELSEPAPKMEFVAKVIGYEGLNRVWQEGDMLSTDSTTQGSGSCYIYYADSPEEQAQSLKLLSAMRVAFVDIERERLLTTAYMDAERYHAESGRVIVPLVLDETSISIEGEGGKTISAIAPLEKNTNTRITAIVYLDGAELSNDEVLAVTDIQGRLNLQFSSSTDLSAVDNDDLASAERSVMASVSEDSFSYDEFAASGDPMTTTVTVRVTGEQPNTLTAFFLRAINSTQGSRELPPMEFTSTGDGLWTATHTFTSPGEYVLRTVRLDGVDYDLEDCPTVTVEGFGISSLTCTEDTDDDNHVTIMTTASSGTVNLRLQFGTTVMPDSVQARYLRTDGSATNVNFTYDGSAWTGSATFLTSGDYTLQYLILDGEYQELDPNWWQTVTAYLGLKVKVETTSLTEFTIGEPNAETDLQMQVTIMDNTGTEMPGLSGAKLYYTEASSSDDRWDTNLTWNGDYYEGEFVDLSAGEWIFNQVTVSGNQLTNATEAPVFTIISPTPPAYVGFVENSYQFAPANDAVVQIKMTEAKTPTVQAYVVNQTKGTEAWVDALTRTSADEDGAEITTLSFPVAEGVNTVTKLRMWTVYDEAGVRHDATNPYEVIVPETIKTTVVGAFNVTFPPLAAGTTTLSGNAFMEAYTVDAGTHSVSITNAVAATSDDNVLLEDVQLVIEYKDGSDQRGGYTSEDLSNETAGATVYVSLTDRSGSGTFQQEDAFKLLYAGNYTTSLRYTVRVKDSANSTAEEPLYREYGVKTDAAAFANAPVFTVSTIAPDVYISDITMDGGNAYSVDLNTTGSLADTSTYTTQSSGCITDYTYTCTTHKDHIFAANNTQYISRIEDSNRTAYLYFKCNHEDVSTYSGGTKNGNTGADFKGHTYLYSNGTGVPAATLTLSGMGEATNAKLTFTRTGGGNVVMITEYTADRSGGTYWGDTSTYGTDAYEWSADGAVSRFIGVMDNGNGSNGSDTKTVAGTITADTLALTYNGMTFNAKIDGITINNPY